MMIYGFGIFADNYTRILSFISIGVGLIIGFISIIEMFGENGGNNEDSEED